ncbi:hypothetical protein [Niastella sp. OAS944]|uniref:hypothetical protein n=1 Tax=Niastella sp. OAS944 TaxID=2664089 RepID=UPI00348874AF|nr:signal transduction histidine kinase [Chitinophagaceae bacterium OAS944]
MRNSNNKIPENLLLKSDWKVTQAQQIKQNKIDRAVLAARENERAKIGQEIQENLNQVLVAALLYIELAKNDEEILDICLEKSSAFISIVIKELAIMSRTLQFKDLDMRPILKKPRKGL